MAVHCAKFDEERAERVIKSSVQKLGYTHLNFRVIKCYYLKPRFYVPINLNFNYIPAAQV